MSISNLKSNTLRGLIKLISRRDSLRAQIEKIESSIAATLEGGKKGAAKPSFQAPSMKRGKRGALKARILALLKAAGDKGIGVKEISTRLGVKNQNVHVWFSSTGKKVPGLKKIAEGRYRLKK